MSIMNFHSCFPKISPSIFWLRQFYQSQKRGHVASTQILTIFTTVGFGDMSAYTTGETLYADWTMSLGRSLKIHGFKGEKTCGYPLVMTNIAIENDH